MQAVALQFDSELISVNTTAGHALIRIQSRRIMFNSKVYVVAKLPGSCITGQRNCLASHCVTMARSDRVGFGAICSTSFQFPSKVIDYRDAVAILPI